MATLAVALCAWSLAMLAAAVLGHTDRAASPTPPFDNARHQKRGNWAPVLALLALAAVLTFGAVLASRAAADRRKTAARGDYTTTTAAATAVYTEGIRRIAEACGYGGTSGVHARLD